MKEKNPIELSVKFVKRFVELLKLFVVYQGGLCAASITIFISQTGFRLDSPIPFGFHSECKQTSTPLQASEQWISACQKLDIV